MSTLSGPVGDVTSSPGSVDLAASTLRDLVYIFVLYLLWDGLGVAMARARDRTAPDRRPKYPTIEDDEPTGRWQTPNYVGTVVTAVFLAALAVVWALTGDDGLSPTWSLALATALLFAYRFTKEVRTSWRTG